MADAAHELRTPLAVVSAQAHALREAPDLPSRLERGEALQEGIQRATALLRQLLAIARLEGPGPAFLPVDLDLAALARERAAALVPLALARRQDLGYEGPSSLPVRGGRRRPGQRPGQPPGERHQVHAAGGHPHGARGARGGLRLGGRGGRRPRPAAGIRGPGLRALHEGPRQPGDGAGRAWAWPSSGAPPRSTGGGWTPCRPSRAGGSACAWCCPAPDPAEVAELINGPGGSGGREPGKRALGRMLGPCLIFRYIMIDY